jgi:hypothetical protein
MYHKVRITKLPGKARGGKVNGNRIVPNQSLSFGGADMKSGPKDISVANTISAVPRNQANLEAEGGETVYGDINGDGMAEHLVIKGPRHSSGGVPLNLPDDTFIFSDTKSMRLKDPNLLSQFGKKGGTSKSTKSYTPAELAKQYDLSKYRKMLQDPESGDLERKTAEIMIRNYTMKLGALALAQEAKKGFPQGIPEVARPYMEANGINDEDLIPEIAQQQFAEEEMMEQGPGMQNPQEEMMEMPQEDMMAMQQPMVQYGMQFGGYDIPFANEMAYGGLFKAQEGTEQTSYQNVSKTKGNIDYNTPEQTNQSQFQGANYNTVWKPKVEAAFADPTKAADLINRLETYSGQDAEDVKNKLRGKSMEEKIIIAKRLATDNKVGPYHYVINNLITPEEKVVEKEEEPYIKISPDPEKEAEIIDRGEYEDVDLTPAPQNIGAEWMTPDKINFYGALKDKSRIKKFMPWAPRVALEVPTPTYLDPTRELGQQSEYANLMAQQLSQFAGPQALASNMSGIQGTGAEQAANTLARINNQNVGLSNQFAQNAANIRNQEQGINQAAAQRLYDQNTMANQQFLNAKTAADQNVRQAFGTGWRNASNLALTNAMYPQYDIDPRSGNIWFQGGKDLTGEAPGATFDSLFQAYRRQGASFTEATAAAKAAMQSQGSQADINTQAILNNTAKKGGQMDMGYVMGSNVFPFMFY